MKKIMVLVSIIMFLCGCGPKEEYKTLMEENDYLIVDVRTNQEFQEGHIKDAINLPVNMINSDIDLESDKLIFVYCKSGNRSKEAYDKLTKLGYEVYDLGSINDIDLPKE